MTDDALVRRVRRRLVAGGLPASRAGVALAVRGDSPTQDATRVLATVDALRDELAGAGPLEPLLHEDGVTDVLVNGAAEVWVDRGRGLELTDVRFGSERELRRLAVRLAAAAGRRLDDAVPCADVRLPDGVRLHAVLPPVSPGRTCLSLRVPARRALTLDDWSRDGATPPAATALLAELIAARLSFVVTGGTGSGKTTLLSTLLGLVDPAQRVVLVEDSAELRPDHPHVVRLEARAANAEGVGAIELRALVREALRMRPDRLVVGEVRGAECVDLLAALNIGHDGGAGTLHANSPADVPARVEALCTAGGLSREAAHSQLAAGVRAVVHLSRDERGRRRVHSVGVLRRAGGGLVEVAPALRVVDGAVVDEPGRRE
ncbi:MAG TPA: TadA family conjugal transfer-associated ATPase, partial [Acidothermaceae bacterium]